MLISTNSDYKAYFRLSAICILCVQYILTIRLYFMHLFDENQYIPIQTSFLCSVKDKNLALLDQSFYHDSRLFFHRRTFPELDQKCGALILNATLLSYHDKYLLISHVSQLWHMITFERGRAGILHLHQSSCHPMSPLFSWNQRDSFGVSSICVFGKK